APEHLIRKARAQVEAGKRQCEEMSLPKWGPFERAPEHLIRKARAQVEAGKRQCEEMSRGQKKRED
ncbi:MAG: hypothetical protein WCP45_13275, partial [Verrucomicrobiota bacterium]